MMMSENPESKREQLERAIAAQEGLRGTLDDAIVDATLEALHKQLAELEQAQVLEQQRKLVTVLFMDVVSSTRLMSELDPEESMAILDAALQKLAVPVETHGVPDSIAAKIWVEFLGNFVDTLLNLVLKVKQLLLNLN